MLNSWLNIMGYMYDLLCHTALNVILKDKLSIRTCCKHLQNVHMCLT